MIGNLYSRCFKGLAFLARPFISKWRYDYWKYSLDWGVMNPRQRKKQKKLFIEALETKKSNIVKSEFHKKRLTFDYMMSHTFVGALTEDYFMHRFNEISWKKRNTCLTQRRLNFFKSNANPEDLWYLLNDKIEFNKRYDKLLNRKWCDIKKISCEEFAEIFSECSRLIIKPIDGNCGKGIYTLDINKDNIKKVYNDILTDAADGDVIVEEYFYQKGILHDINPHSLNTLRVSTVRISGENDICEAYLRTGCGESIVDNFHSGGIIFPINNDTGKCYSGFNLLGEQFEVHPLSNIHVSGMTIPQWEKIKEFCFKAHNMLPEDLHWIGWDICLSNEEIILIEGNAGPGTYNENINHWKNFKKWLEMLYEEK